MPTPQEDLLDDDGNVKPPEEMKQNETVDFSDNATDEQKTLLNRVNKRATAWIPAPGDSIVGVLVELNEAESDYGAYPLLTIETPDGEFVMVHAFHTTLKNQINRKADRGQLAEGDDIAISFQGEGVAKAGINAPRLYQVAIVHRP